MVEYATRADLRQFASELRINEQAAVRKRAEDRNPAGATFLSHSSQDEELVVGTIKLLEGHGAEIYVDKKDPELPPYTSKETAGTLKVRIHQSKRFVLLASKHSKDSRWVPWELGLADENKGLDRVAILPAVEQASDTTWSTWEYLGLYDRIVWGRFDGEAENIWMVWDFRRNEATRLSTWLRR